MRAGGGRDADFPDESGVAGGGYYLGGGDSSGEDSDESEWVYYSMITTQDPIVRISTDVAGGGVEVAMAVSSKLRMDYTFDASAKTITFAESIDLRGIQVISNKTFSNTVIYNFTSSVKSGSLVGNVLTLTYDTSAMSDTDELEIIYEDGGMDEADVTFSYTGSKVTGIVVTRYGMTKTMVLGWTGDNLTSISTTVT